MAKSSSLPKIIPTVNIHLEISGKNISKKHGPSRIGEQRRSVLDYKKFHEDFGWKPKIHMEQGLIETYNFYQNEAV